MSLDLQELAADLRAQAGRLTNAADELDPPKPRRRRKPAADQPEPVSDVATTDGDELGTPE